MTRRSEMDVLGQLPPNLAAVMRKALLALARTEADLANAEAARVPYWAPCPASVLGHRAAAEALRADADRLAFAY